MKVNRIRHILSFLLAFAMVLGLLPGMTLTALADTAFGGGDGTENNPYVIRTLEHLKELQQVVSAGTDYEGKYFILDNSIDLGNEEWTPIGTATCTPSGNSWPISDAKPFQGIFDGNGKTISGLLISGDKNVQGLFGYVDTSGVVKNLTVSGSVRGNVLIGGIVGYNKGTVLTCHNQTDVGAKGLFHDTGNIAGGGGVVGTNQGTVKGCSNTGMITGITPHENHPENYKDGTNIGGVVGGNEGTVTECWNTGSINAAGNSGGVMGANYGTLSKCYNEGDVAGTSWSVAGLLGINRYGGSVENCYNTGVLKSTGFGNSGIVGTQQSYENFKNCYNYGTVALGSGESYGLIIGGNSGSTPVNCYYPDNLASEQLNTAGGSALTNEQFAKQESFSEWDFDDVWYLDNGVRPLLRSTPESLPDNPVFEYDAAEKKLIITADSQDPDVKIYYSTDGKRPEVTSTEAQSGQPIEDLSNGLTINIIMVKGHAVKLSTSYVIPYTVTFDTDGGSPVPEVQAVASDETATEPTTNPTKTGNTFVGWFEENAAEAYDFDTPITGNLTLIAKWEEKPRISYNVTFRVINGSWNDGNTEDITVTLGGYEGDELNLTADQIPAAGMMPNDNYKVGAWDITPGTEVAINRDMLYTYTYMEKVAATISAVSTPEELTYTGGEQELVNEVTSTGGTVKYALGTDAITVPQASAFTESIPTGVNAGIYYVWCMVQEDDEYKASEPICVPVSIGKKVDTTKESLEDREKPVAKTGLIYNGEEQPLVYTPGKLPAGYEKVQYSIDGGTTWTDMVPSGKDAGDYTIKVRYVGDSNHQDFEGEDISVSILAKAQDSTPEPSAPVSLTPEPSTPVSSTPKPTTLDNRTDSSASTSGEQANTKKANEAAELALNTGLKISQSGSKIKIKWGKVEGADGYDVYVTYCGMKFNAAKPSKTLNKNTDISATVKKINGRKIDLKKNYKIYVAAFKVSNGKKIWFAKTIIGHIVGRKNTKYTNVKKVTVSKNKYTLKAGKKIKIKAKTILVDKNKKQLSNAHATQFRYASTNKMVATVDKNGTIEGKGSGTCIIYVYARNGYAKKVRVTVK